MLHGNPETHFADDVLATAWSMTRRFLTLAATLVGISVPLVGEAQQSRAALGRGSFAIVDVGVIPMTSDTVLRRITVVVRDGRIVAIGPRGRVSIPAGARQIDGSGKYLIPGLADVHTHMYSDDLVPDSIGRYELGVLIANGITAARFMIGTPAQLALRKEIEAGTLVGPQLWSASPQFTGRRDVNARVVTTPDQARAAVKEVAAAGYDFVKISNFITPDVYDAIIAEARERKIPVDGHVDPRVSVPHALASGQHIQHLDGYFEAVLADSSPIRESVSQYGAFQLKNWASLDHMDNRKIAQLAGMTARAGIWSTPTLTIFNTAFAVGQLEDQVRLRPDWKLMPDEFRNNYSRANTRYWADSTRAYRTDARRRRYVEVRNSLTKAIHDSGGKILAGSDAPEWFLGYGWTLHRELGSLVAAGLTPYQALVAATRNPAEFLGMTREWGTIEQGKRADLVLLDANPLEDIGNTTRIAAVMLGGRWFEREALNSMVALAAQKIRGDKP